MSSLGPDARALLEATSDGDDPTQLDAARVRAKIEQRLVLSAGVAAATSAATGAQAGVTTIGSSSAGSVAAAAGAVPLPAAAASAAAASAAASAAAGTASLAGGAVASGSFAVGKVLLIVALAGGAVGTGVEVHHRLLGGPSEPAAAAPARPSPIGSPAANAPHGNAANVASGSPVTRRMPQPAAPSPPLDGTKPVLEKRSPVRRTATIAQPGPFETTAKQGQSETIAKRGPTETIAKRGASGAPRREGNVDHPERSGNAAPRPVATPRSRSSAPPSLASPAQRDAAAPSAPPARDSILDEAALLRAARSAIAGGEGARALQHLDEHAAKFPHGALQEEAAAARVLALCAAGRAAEARAVAAEFLVRRANSPLAAQVRQACASSNDAARP